MENRRKKLEEGRQAVSPKLKQKKKLNSLIDGMQATYTFSCARMYLYPQLHPLIYLSTHPSIQRSISRSFVRGCPAAQFRFDNNKRRGEKQISRHGFAHARNLGLLRKPRGLGRVAEGHATHHPTSASPNGSIPCSIVPTKF